MSNFNGGAGFEKYPEFSCYYYNESDPRVCVCGRDKMNCGKKTCVANLATTGGKIIQSLLIMLVIGLIVYGLFQRGLFKG